MITAVAAVLAAVACWVGVPARPRQRAARMSAGPSARRQPGPRVRSARARLRLGPGARRDAARERLRTVQALGALAAELEAGQSPHAAVLGAGGGPSAWPAATAAATAGADIAVAFESDARDHPALAHVAACWRVASETGTGLAVAVGRLAASARVAEDSRVQLEAELAGPRATARMLAVLPVAGIGFGALLGSDPLGWLLLTAPGWMCLTAGLALTALGLAWTARIAASVERLL